MGHAVKPGEDVPTENENDMPNENITSAELIC